MNLSSGSRNDDVKALQAALNATGLGGKFYAIAGQVNGSGGYTKEIEEFTPDSGESKWRSKANLPYIANSLGAAYNGNIYTFGGKNNFTVYKYIYKYNPAANQWTSIGNMPSGCYGMGVVEHEGKIYLLGGYNSNHQALAAAANNGI